MLLILLNQILSTNQPTNRTTINNQAILCPTNNFCCNTAAVGDFHFEIFTELCANCLRPIQLLDWCLKLQSENYKNTDKMRKQARKKSYPLNQRRKRLLGKFPKSLHFKKVKEPSGGKGHPANIFWKKFLTYSDST